MSVKRIFLTVMDSFGIGGAHDAEAYGNKGAYTLKTISKSHFFKARNLAKLGLFNIDGLNFEKDEKPIGKYARMTELSKGKDTVTGHWELSGLILDKPFPTYPNGFPKEICDEFEKRTGQRILCNKPYSGTQVLRDYGEEHLKNGGLIVYTSADSVFQIAAHEGQVTVPELYKYCETAREILCGEHCVGRVIARPFGGDNADNFYRTENRHDFSLKPFGKTVLDILKNSGKDVISVGKIYDIFSGCGITEAYKTKNNIEGIQRLSELTERDFTGLCFTNLVDFDMLYGHRNDIDGYARAVSYFDENLGSIFDKLTEEDIFIITADHGCDPGFPGTDHTRENVPLLIYQKGQESENLGTITGFDFVSELILKQFGIC